MNWPIAIVGVLLIIVLGVAGLFAGEVKRVLDDPNVKEKRERREKEAERQRRWKERRDAPP